MSSFRVAAGRLSSPKEEMPLNPEDESCARLVTVGCDGDRVERPLASRGLARMGGRWGFDFEYIVLALMRQLCV